MSCAYINVSLKFGLRKTALCFLLAVALFDVLSGTSSVVAGEPSSFAPVIWLYWGQGWNDRAKLPRVVQFCRDRVLALHGQQITRREGQQVQEQNEKAGRIPWEIRFVDSDTIWNWIDFSSPSTLSDLLRAGDIGSIKSRLNSISENTPQILSDLVRLLLLVQHGGLWIDASVILLEPLDWVYYIFYARPALQSVGIELLDSWGPQASRLAGRLSVLRDARTSTSDPSAAVAGGIVGAAPQMQCQIAQRWLTKGNANASSLPCEWGREEAPGLEVSFLAVRSPGNAFLSRSLRALWRTAVTLEDAPCYQLNQKQGFVTQNLVGNPYHLLAACFQYVLQSAQRELDATGHAQLNRRRRLSRVAQYYRNRTGSAIGKRLEQHPPFGNNVSMLTNNQTHISPGAPSLKMTSSERRRTRTADRIGADQPEAEYVVSQHPGTAVHLFGLHLVDLRFHVPLKHPACRFPRPVNDESAINHSVPREDVSRTLHRDKANVIKQEESANLCEADVDAQALKIAFRASEYKRFVKLTKLERAVIDANPQLWTEPTSLLYANATSTARID
ncbi:unnamed protein product [Amoebophrya sp. A25]|nr:unnamed protein product [Amoebophrya sp. A25]|eukprot:GSA25T00009886001.1